MNWIGNYGSRKCVFFLDCALLIMLMSCATQHQSIAVQAYKAMTGMTEDHETKTAEMWECLKMHKSLDQVLHTSSVSLDQERQSPCHFVGQEKADANRSPNLEQGHTQRRRDPTKKGMNMRCKSCTFSDIMLTTKKERHEPTMECMNRHA